MRRFLLISSLVLGVSAVAWGQTDDIYATGAEQRNRGHVNNSTDNAVSNTQGNQNTDDPYANQQTQPDSSYADAPDNYLDFNNPDDYINYDDEDNSYASRFNR